ncbi:molecular chaperone DnaJ [Gordonibacter sp. An230]|uniref:J domain-containing protein n=1 Tax=Gordonibacter sp. An230 TaxID=1965592 RepID=UPI000B38EE93|nr:J domain-containing protein [Gordonibacter sp. An230]OUO92372.1 molecular chaperone DnaJ [Gordonibacter sp. An230]
MNRTEALRILGLGDDATAEDIKAAYKETAQILHPDRFAGNKKLQDRATEQFKNLQEAYEYLTKGRGARRSSKPGSAARTPRTAANNLEARLAGIAAARMQLVKQRDAAYDERRNGIGMAVIGMLVALFAGRRPVGVLGLVTAIATTAAVWGIVQTVSAQRTIATLDEHIESLNKEERRLSQELEDEE